MFLKDDRTISHRALDEITNVIIGRFNKRLNINKVDDVNIWGTRYTPHYHDTPPSNFHKYMGGRLSGASIKRGVREVFIGPRGSAKSTSCTFDYPLKAICEETEKYIIIISDTVGQAEKYLSDIKDELTTNADLKQEYPDAFGEGPIWNTGRIVTRNGICIEALGSGSKIRGRRFRQHRPSCIIIDDPEGDDAAFSALKRDRTWEWFVKGVLKAVGPGTNIIVVGTMVHRQCLVGRLSLMPGWKSCKFQSIISWPDRMDLWEHIEEILSDISDPDNDIKALAFYKDNRVEMDRGAQVLWPERESLYDLMFIRAVEGHPAFESEKQNNPIDPSKCEWLPDHFPLSADSLLWFDEWPVNALCKVMSLDPSKGRQDKPGDYQAIISLAVHNGLIYVDADIARRPLTTLCETMFDKIDAFLPDVAVIEDNVFQELLVGEVQQIADKRGLLAPVEGMGNFAVPKEVRIRRLSPYVTRNRIRYKRNSRGIRELIDQMRDFPNGSHVDGPDALEMAVRRAGELLHSRNRQRVTNPR